MPDELTPNHVAKRAELVKAAQAVLRRDGIKGCTSRAVARESGLNNGLIHYYFRTVDAMIDAAVGELVDEIVAQISAAADGADDPAERFWVVVETHLSTFESPPGKMVLWMDYWVDAVREGRAETIGRIDDTITEALTDALARAGIPDATTRAAAVCSYVTGAALRRAIRPQTLDELRSEIALMSGGLALSTASRR